jgi:hypothetical protein
VRLELEGMADGQHAGLCHLSAARRRDNAAANSASLGVVQAGTKRFLELSRDGTLTRGPALTSSAVWLKSSWDLEGLSQFFYSVDGETFKASGQGYQLVWGSCRGDRVGLFTFNNAADAGHVDVDSVRYAITRGLPAFRPPERAAEPRSDTR